MWLTTMFHVGTGLPWDWRTGPSDSSERDHLRQMIGALPAGALITADAGFVGYETWKAILDSGRHLLIRVGANVRLLRKLGYVEEKAGLFVRREIDVSMPTDEGYFVRKGIAAGAKVVTTSAGQLLARELGTAAD